MYPGAAIPSGIPPKPVLHGTSPPTASAAPSAIPRTHPQYMPNVTLPSGSPSMQMQPLDLGMSSSKNENNAPSPKRKGTPPVHLDRSDSPAEAKKRKLEPPSVSSPQILYSVVGQPQLTRVNEPTPLIASEATTITTVVNSYDTSIPTAGTSTPPAASTTSATNPVTLTENLPDLSVTPVCVDVVSAVRPSSADAVQQIALTAPTTNSDVTSVLCSGSQPVANTFGTTSGKESPTASIKVRKILNPTFSIAHNYHTSLFYRS